MPEFKAGEELVVSLCVDDGAIVYLNGQEIGRLNMPEGRVDAGTLALAALGDSDEGFYHRIRVPAGPTLPGKENLIAVEVHQASPSSSDLFFDLAVLVKTNEEPPRQMAEPAMKIMTEYRQRHFVGPEVRIPDGYLDGGRYMVISEGQRIRSDVREILRVDRKQDPLLGAQLVFSSSAEFRALPPLERVRRISARIDSVTTPRGGMRWLDDTADVLAAEYKGRPVLIGDWVEQGEAGVCRHRSLLFKILADEAGLRASLVRGNYVVPGMPGFAHAWNEIYLDDGRRLLVDVMHEGGMPRFREVTSPDVIEHYRKVDDTPWYGQLGK